MLIIKSQLLTLNRDKDGNDERGGGERKVKITNTIDFIRWVVILSLMTILGYLLTYSLTLWYNNNK